MGGSLSITFTGEVEYDNTFSYAHKVIKYEEWHSLQPSRVFAVGQLPQTNNNLEIYTTGNYCIVPYLLPLSLVSLAQPHYSDRYTFVLDAHEALEDLKDKLGMTIVFGEKYISNAVWLTVDQNNEFIKQLPSFPQRPTDVAITPAQGLFPVVNNLGVGTYGLLPTDTKARVTQLGTNGSLVTRDVDVYNFCTPGWMPNLEGVPKPVGQEYFNNCNLFTDVSYVGLSSAQYTWNMLTPSSDEITQVFSYPQLFTPYCIMCKRDINLSYSVRGEGSNPFSQADPPVAIYLLYLGLRKVDYVS